MKHFCLLLIVDVLFVVPFCWNPSVLFDKTRFSFNNAGMHLSGWWMQLHSSRIKLVIWKSIVFFKYLFVAEVDAKFIQGRLVFIPQLKSMKNKEVGGLNHINFLCGSKHSTRFREGMANSSVRKNIFQFVCRWQGWFVWIIMKKLLNNIQVCLLCLHIIEPESLL